MHLSGVKDQKYEVVVGDDAMVGTCSTRQHNQNKLSLLNVQENPRLVPLIKAEENIKVQNLASVCLLVKPLDFSPPADIGCFCRDL